ncbi:hypothetical protein N0V93_009471 [Gnomoniopsis smithogilvyi]|uniref:Integral membrane protein n=1 Tax=Gnomoniopsis smithogilvyi TaxID=1191159 RepID=A0A9W8YKX2_9PEZI|nr:hypothetical protein N0V93_009471 [Gnomoniopsis smithogilvyi]
MAGPFESISPLPPDVRKSLIAMTSVGLTSLVMAGLLFCHITYKLVSWKIRDIKNQKGQLEQRGQSNTKRNSIDLNMGLAEDHYYQAKGHKPSDSRETVFPSAQRESSSQETAKNPRTDAGPQFSLSIHREKPPNPLLLLIYNLLLSDIVLSASYASDAVWLRMDGIIAPSLTCTVQGWIVSCGCLTTSGFLFAIAIFSYLGIIRGYKATSRDVLIACSIVWILSLFLSSLGPMYFRDDTYYGRETTWCWISEKRRLWRLTVYVMGFLCLIGTQFIYGYIFYRLWREGRSSRFMPRRQGSESASVSRVTSGRDGGTDSTALRPSGHHPAFLIYPCIYTLTGTPLILGSLIPVLERNARFMGAAGSLLAVTGLLDTVLWSSIILFSKNEDLANTGLDQFSFMRTPEGRTLGNIVFVQGGDQGNERRVRRQSWHSRKEKGWWRLGDRASISQSPSREWGPESDDGNRGIQMEVVTSVVVEGEGSTSHSRNFSRGHRGMSLESSI